MWKFIKIQPYKSKYYNKNKVMSYTPDFLYIIGARRIGKTFTFKEHCIRRFQKYGEKFVWIRDTVTAVEKLSANHGEKFFEDVNSLDMKIDNIESHDIKGNSIFINDECCGSVLAASNFQHDKGGAFKECKCIVLDEAIPERNRRKNIYAVWELVNSLYTIASTRKDCKIICLANALDKGDPFLQMLKLKIKNYGLYYNKDDNFLVHYCENSPAFEKEARESVMGRLIKNTEFSSNLIDASFFGDSEYIVDKLPPKTKLAYIIHIGDYAIRLYIKDGIYFAFPDINKKVYNDKRFAIDIDNIDKTKGLLPNDIKKQLIFARNCNWIYYNNAFLRKILNSL